MDPIAELLNRGAQLSQLSLSIHLSFELFRLGLQCLVLPFQLFPPPSVFCQRNNCQQVCLCESFQLLGHAAQRLSQALFPGLQMLREPLSTASSL
jgi:hypothetical protein